MHRQSLCLRKKLQGHRITQKLKFPIMLPDYLTSKYNVAVPRYTSYPTMPYWDTASFDTGGWVQSVRLAFKESNDKQGISLYIHLPFCENLCTYCGCNT